MVRFLREKYSSVQEFLVSVELKEGCWVLRIITYLRHDDLPTKGLINPCCEVPYLRGRQYSGSQYFMKGVGGVEIGVIQIWSE